MRDRHGWSRLSGPGVVFAAMAMIACAQGMAAQSVPMPAVQGAEAAGKLREYEVVSIKENKSNDGMVRMMSTPDGFSTTNMTLNNLIANAYGVRYDLISGGPGWVGSRGFDVEAKVTGPDIEAYKKLTDKDRDAMMKAFLEERFNLQVHIETKELQVYDLVLAKGGVKMKEATPDAPDSDSPEDLKPDAKAGPPPRRNGMMRMGLGTLSGTGLPMQQIADQLSYVVHHPVRNKTGLDGKYDVELKWTSEGDRPKQDNGSADTAPSVFTAVQEQLGLKLQSTKGPVDTLVIDHVTLPSEN